MIVIGVQSREHYLIFDFLSNSLMLILGQKLNWSVLDKLTTYILSQISHLFDQSNLYLLILYLEVNTFESPIFNFKIINTLFSYY
jgi:hypothetical protein